MKRVAKKSVVIISFMVLITLFVPFLLLEGFAQTTNGSWADSAEEVSVNSDGITYEITSPGNLAWIAQQTHAGFDFTDKIIVLLNDIDLGGKEWVTIGENSKQFFNGTFVGGGFTINNLTINDDYLYGQYYGLFGYSGPMAHISGFSINGNITVSGSSVGGVVGVNQGVIDNVNSSVTITGEVSVGGIAGNMTGNSTSKVVNCLNNGSINGSSSVGGIIGSFLNGTVANSYNVGAITAKNSVGGVVGNLGNLSDGSTLLINVYNIGEVKLSVEDEYSDFGSVVGYRSNSSAKIENAFYLTGTSEVGDKYGKEFESDGILTSSVNIDGEYTQSLYAVLNNYVLTTNSAATPPTVDLMMWTDIKGKLPVLPIVSVLKDDITGTVSTENGERITLDLLNQGTDTVIYSTYFAAKNGETDTKFVLTNIADGTYDLIVTKTHSENHYMIHTLTGVIKSTDSNTVFAKVITPVQLPGNDDVIGIDDIQGIFSDISVYNNLSVNGYGDFNLDGKVNFADLAFARNTQNQGNSETTI